MDWLDDSIHTRGKGKFTSDNPQVLPGVLYAVWFYPERKTGEVATNVHPGKLHDVIFEGTPTEIFAEKERREQSGRPVKIVNWVHAKPPGHSG